MSGHSKWSTIKRKKGEKDNARAKIFTKISREILVCIRENGSADPSANGKLRDLIAKAKSNNIPGDNIDRLLKKAQGGEKNDYENCVYEGYGPSGVALMIDCLTDNRNRTAGEIRHYLSKYGGNLGASGCVAFMFGEKGAVVVDNEDGDIQEDDFMEKAIDAGADEYVFEDGVIQVFTAVNEAGNVAEALKANGYTVLSAQNEQIPSSYTDIEDEETVKKLTTLLDLLEDNDDVQNVWHNAEFKE